MPEVLRRLVSAARLELGMDIAWISRFGDGCQVLWVVDGVTEAFGVAEGDQLSYQASYCSRVAAGELPNLIPDAVADPRTVARGITEQFGIGAYARGAGARQRRPRVRHALLHRAGPAPRHG